MPFLGFASFVFLSTRLLVTLNLFRVLIVKYSYYEVNYAKF